MTTSRASAAEDAYFAQLEAEQRRDNAWEKRQPANVDRGERDPGKPGLFRKIVRAFRGRSGRRST
jgi:hypothetical protein